jgi:diadenosine tetraphosphate (Ap4A) HIT family hydrolase
MGYDKENIFAKILRGEIPCDKVYEDEHALAFRDINPQAPVHVLVVPKGSYINTDDFSAKASDAEIVGYIRAVGQVGRELGIVNRGFRTLANNGPDAHQEVPHFHTHIFAGRDLGHMIKAPKD